MTTNRETPEMGERRPSGKWESMEVALIRAFVDRVERRAEQAMLKTGKLEGAHYAAMKAELAVLESAVPVPLPTSDPLVHAAPELARIPGEEARLNAVIGLMRDVREILAYEADAFDSDRCADAVATIDEFMGWRSK